MAQMGAQPRTARTQHQNITAEQWQYFREQHDHGAHLYEPDPVLPVQAWSEGTMEILLMAVGPPTCRTGARLEAQEWGVPMAGKRRW